MAPTESRIRSSVGPNPPNADAEHTERMGCEEGLGGQQEVCDEQTGERDQRSREARRTQGPANSTNVVRERGSTT